MSKRGPKPTPTPILKLRGSWRGQNRPSGFMADQKRPPCPKRFIVKRKTEDAEHVRRVSKSIWNALVKPLYDAGLLNMAYRPAFESFCDSWGRWELACQKCDEFGMVTQGSKDNEVKSPWFAIRKETQDQVFKGAACFGLTPADISSVRATEKPTKNEKKKFFGGAS